MAENQSNQQLLTLRIIWAAMLMGELVIAAILTVATLQMGGDAGPSAVFLAIGVVVAAGGIGAAFLLRNQFYKRGWQDNALTMQAYTQGTIAFAAALEAPVVINAILMLISGAIAAHLALIGLCVAIHLFSFPTGKPLQATEPRIQGQQ
jgi:hypothetical protein